MDVLRKPLTLNSSGRPVLLADEDEVELVLQDKVAIYIGDERSPTYPDGFCCLTTHRLLWYMPDSARSFGLDLAAVSVVEYQGKGLTTSAKITLHLTAPCPLERRSEAFLRVRQVFPPHVPDLVLLSSLEGKGNNPDAAISALIDSDAASSTFAMLGYLRLSFRSGGSSAFHAKLKDTIEARPWLVRALRALERAAQQQKAREFDPSRTGVGGIMRSLEASQRQTQETLDSAFMDLRALMSKAADMVTLAERFTQKLSKGAAADDAEADEFRTYLVSMGISSPVTKETAGGLYDEQLSRQLAEFLGGLAKARGGLVITMADLYCYFNRARGNALVSPEDLVRACSLFSKLALPFGMGKFSTGVQYVYSADYSERKASLRLLALARERPRAAITELDAARRLRVSVVMARELLLVAEAAGFLCRDETVHSLRFFENLFLRETLPPAA